MIIEDDLFSRTLLTDLLTLNGFDVVGDTETADGAISILAHKKPEVALLDLELTIGPNGIDIAYALRRINPLIGLVFLTSFSDPRLSDSRNLPLPKGAIYLNKGELNQSSKLVTSVIHARQHPVANKVTPRRMVNLTDSQIEVLRLVAQGQTTQGIAQERGVTEKSVEAMLQRLHKQLGLERDRHLNPRIQLTRAFLVLSGKNIPDG